MTWFKRNKPDGRTITMWPGSAMHGYFGWKHPRFEDFEYTSWLPEDDTMAWLGNGNTVAELTSIGDTTGYMDYTDTSKILPVATKDYIPPPVSQTQFEPTHVTNGTRTTSTGKDKQDQALQEIDDTVTPNTALDANAPAETKLAASEEMAPLGKKTDPGNELPGSPRRGIKIHFN